MIQEVKFQIVINFMKIMQENIINIQFHCYLSTIEDDL